MGDPCRPTTGPCSAAATILSLTDLKYRSASVSGSCSHQVDWPWTGGTLRDGSMLPGKVAACGVLDRLPAFQYRYSNSKTIIDSPTTTLDDGGDCHMGRPASISKPIDQNCTLVSKADDHMVLQCPLSPTPVIIQRRRSDNISMQQRIRCESCDPLPMFKAADGTPIAEPEVSYGQPWRWAPERMLAHDLRFRMCGNATDCPSLDPEVWKIGKFWPAMMSSHSPSLHDLFQVVPDQVTDDQWSKQWLSCTNNGSGVHCNGTISKSDWLADRAGTCKRVADQADTAVDLTVCQLDPTLDMLCRTIQNARYRLFEANCQLTGACRTTAFFYQPATYSISNDQFVRQTVQYFYNFTVNGACPVYDTELAAIISNNRHTAQQCSAQSLEVMQFAIQVMFDNVKFVNLDSLTQTYELTNVIFVSFNGVKLRLMLQTLFGLGGKGSGPHLRHPLLLLRSDWHAAAQSHLRQRPYARRPSDHGIPCTDPGAIQAVLYHPW